MNDTDDDFPDDGEFIDIPSLETEKGRDEVLEFLIDNDLACECSVVQEGRDMVLRIRYPDGNEELFDVEIRRSREIVRRDPEGIQN